MHAPASVVVVGGAVLDIRARSAAALTAATSNPGEVTTHAGGVGRNIAENLARLGTTTHLVAVVGDDVFGENLLGHTGSVGVHLDHVVVGSRPTGTYLAVLDESGELAVAVSDMSATDALTVEDVRPARPVIERADLLVVDGNIPADVTAWLLEEAAEGSVPVVLEPVSVVKAARMCPVLAAGRPVLIVTPNLDELAALVGRDVPDSEPEVARAALDLHDLGVMHVWVRRGARGSLLSSRPAGVQAATVTTNSVVAQALIDVTGAGDSMTAGFVHAWLREPDAVSAAAYGQATAALTAESAHTVRPDLTDALVTARLTQGHR